MRLKKQEQDRLKALSKALYLAENGTTLKDLAERVGVSPATLSGWIKAEGWDALRKSLLTTKKAQIARLYDLLEHATKEDKPNADQISKLTASIERLETQSSIADIISVAKDFIEYISQMDYEKSKEITLLFDAFIQHKLKL